jgi:signal transduction histidine kinase
MSHELRTPLNAVIGLSESLLEEGAPFESTRTTRYLGIIHQSGRQLLAKINAMIDLGRMDAGRIKPIFALLDLGVFCASVVEVVQRDFQVKAVSLALVRPELPVQVPADEKLLRQLLQNLLNNALKFTPQHGTVSVLVSSRPEGGAAISVEDSGVGMAEGKLAQIFRPFTQGDGSLSRQIGGTGLGLALVARIARLHGATVSVRSQPGRGSTFTLELRSKPVLAAPLP